MQAEVIPKRALTNMHVVPGQRQLSWVNSPIAQQQPQQQPPMQPISDEEEILQQLQQPSILHEQPPAAAAEEAAAAAVPVALAGAAPAVAAAAEADCPVVQALEQELLQPRQSADVPAQTEQPDQPQQDAGANKCQVCKKGLPNTSADGADPAACTCPRCFCLELISTQASEALSCGHVAPLDYIHWKTRWIHIHIYIYKYVETEREIESYRMNLS
jgi:hypothetical protein